MQTMQQQKKNALLPNAGIKWPLHRSGPLEWLVRNLRPEHAMSNCGTPNNWSDHKPHALKLEDLPKKTNRTCRSEMLHVNVLPNEIKPANSTASKT
jgi:hypothetical protein